MERFSFQALVGAAFLMATSAIGPGFLTQTSLFTSQFLGAMLGIVLIVIALDIIAQLNIWSVIGSTGLRGQDLANKILPGLGYVVSFVICLGGLAFNIGNVAGAGLGLHILLNIDLKLALGISGVLAILIFVSKNAQGLVDIIVKWLGVIMIVTMLYVVFKSQPSFSAIFSTAGEVTQNLTLGSEMSSSMIFAILTLLGGSCGGYITFAGIHRLIDAKITGKENLLQIRKSLFIGISVSGSMRILLFLVVLGVIIHGGVIDKNDPAASAFRQGAGLIGYKIFGLVIFFASITSVIGAAYTSVSFLKTLSTLVANNEKRFIIAFIFVSTLIMIIVGRPTDVLIIVGALNGLILPLMLLIILIASCKKSVMGDYTPSIILRILGLAVVLGMGYFGISEGLKNIIKLIGGFLS